MCIVQDLLLIQLWHYDHARSRVQGALLDGVTNAKNVVLIHEQESFLLLEVLSGELTHVVGKQGFRKRFVLH